MSKRQKIVRSTPRPAFVNCVACEKQMKNSKRGRDRQWCSSKDCDTVRIAWQNARSRHAKIVGAHPNELVAPHIVLQRLVKQDWKCARTGMQLVKRGVRHSTAHHHPASVSLDQIDAGVGYIADNIEVVAFQYNAAKGQLSRNEGEELLLQMASAVKLRREQESANE